MAKKVVVKTFDPRLFSPDQALSSLGNLISFFKYLLKRVAFGSESQKNEAIGELEKFLKQAKSGQTDLTELSELRNNLETLSQEPKNKALEEALEQILTSLQQAAEKYSATKEALVTFLASPVLVPAKPVKKSRVSKTPVSSKPAKPGKTPLTKTERIIIAIGDLHANGIPQPKAPDIFKMLVSMGYAANHPDDRNLLVPSLASMLRVKKEPKLIERKGSVGNYTYSLTPAGLAKVAKLR